MKDGTVVIVERPRPVDHEKDQIGIFNPLKGAFDADALDGVVGIANPRRVDQFDGKPLDVKPVFDHVPGGAGEMGDDGPLLF